MRRLTLNPRHRKGRMALTQTQLAQEVADRAEVTRADVKRVLAALEEIVLEELGNAEKVKIGGRRPPNLPLPPRQKGTEGPHPRHGRGDHDWAEARRCCAAGAAA